MQEYHSIGIYEPCNYASNLAYYHMVTMICDNQEWSLPAEYTKAMVQAFTCKKTNCVVVICLNILLFSALTVGSAF